jgi:DNA-binding transcriptional MerR regulator
VLEVDIAEVARRSRVPASTLRFYEEKGLIASIGRRGLRRVFDPGVLERLALVALGRGAGFSLDEIALMFAPDGRPRIDRRLLAAKAEEADRKIRELTTMRDGWQRRSGERPWPPLIAAAPHGSPIWRGSDKRGIQIDWGPIRNAAAVMAQRSNGRW